MRQLATCALTVFAATSAPAQTISLLATGNRPTWAIDTLHLGDRSSRAWIRSALHQATDGFVPFHIQRL
jgi:hypothetical protein